VAGVPVEAGLTPLEELDPPDIDLGALEDLQGTLRLLQETGALP
jgi:iron(III) transport system substrate-binding protein